MFIFVQVYTFLLSLLVTEFLNSQQWLGS